MQMRKVRNRRKNINDQKNHTEYNVKKKVHHCAKSKLEKQAKECQEENLQL